MDLGRLFRPKTMAVVGVSQANDRHPANVIYVIISDTDVHGPGRKGRDRLTRVLAGK